MSKNNYNAFKLVCKKLKALRSLFLAVFKSFTIVAISKSAQILLRAVSRSLKTVQTRSTSVQSNLTDDLEFLKVD